MFRKKIRMFLLLAITLVGSIVGIKNVSAATDGIKAGKYVDGPYYYEHTRGSSAFYEQSQFIVRKSDGAWVYCVQPFVHIADNNTYDVTTEDLAAVANISQSNWKTIERIAYYGYGYVANGYDHSAEKWWAAAQMLIWQYADPNVQSYFTSSLHGARNDNILRAEMNEIMNLVNNHTITPNLNGLPSEMIIGDSITINDSNGVLASNYNIADVSNGSVNKNGNSLTITATNVGTISFKLQNLGNRYGEPVRLYYASNSQNAVRRGNIDPINLNLNIKVYGGKVTTDKTDYDTFTNEPQGEASLAGAEYGVYKEDGTKVATITTDATGKATSDYLPSLGRFYLLEEKASTGYQLVESNIENLIYEIRGRQVMLDSDLAKLFNYSTKDLNRNVKNNFERFSMNYYFQLTLEEVNILSSRSQNFTLNKSGNLRGYNLKYLPYVFTKHGVLILVGILKSDIEVKNDLRKVSRKNFFNIIQL